jgi:hypothetical protein
MPGRSRFRLAALDDAGPKNPQPPLQAQVLAALFGQRDARQHGWHQ